MAGHVPAISRGTISQQMAGTAAGHDGETTAMTAGDVSAKGRRHHTLNATFLTTLAENATEPMMIMPSTMSCT